MKKLLLLLCLLPCAAFGQRLELGLNAGAVMFSGMQSSYARYNKSLNTAMYVSGTVSLRLKKYDLGLRMAGNEQVGKESNGYYNTMAYAQNLYAIALQGNRHVAINKLDAYGGVYGGVLFYKNPSTSNMALLFPTGEFASSKGIGYTAGIQFGCNYPLTKRFALTAEASAGYCHINAQNDYVVAFGKPALKYHYSYFTYPVTVGVKYTLR